MKHTVQICYEKCIKEEKEKQHIYVEPIAFSLQIKKSK